MEREEDAELLSLLEPNAGGQDLAPESPTLSEEASAPSEEEEDVPTAPSNLLEAQVLPEEGETPESLSEFAGDADIDASEACLPEAPEALPPGPGDRFLELFSERIRPKVEERLAVWISSFEFEAKLENP
jgi:hypothetical protein